jgi:hypothetical protein
MTPSWAVATTLYRVLAGERGPTIELMNQIHFVGAADAEDDEEAARRVLDYEFEDEADAGWRIATWEVATLNRECANAFGVSRRGDRPREAGSEA